MNGTDNKVFVESSFNPDHTNKVLKEVGSCLFTFICNLCTSAFTLCTLPFSACFLNQNKYIYLNFQMLLNRKVMFYEVLFYTKKRYLTVEVHLNEDSCKCKFWQFQKSCFQSFSTTNLSKVLIQHGIPVIEVILCCNFGQIKKRSQIGVLLFLWVFFFSHN